jgi:hypothetical protein
MATASFRGDDEVKTRYGANIVMNILPLPIGVGEYVTGDVSEGPFLAGQMLEGATSHRHFERENMHNPTTYPYHQYRPHRHQLKVFV